MSSTWFVYVLECADGTLYTGITTDLERRVHEHNHTRSAARYTRARRPVELVAHWRFPSQSEAASVEWHFKQLKRDDKLAHIEQDAPPEFS